MDRRWVLASALLFAGVQPGCNKEPSGVPDGPCEKEGAESCADDVAEDDTLYVCADGKWVDSNSTEGDEVCSCNEDGSSITCAIPGFVGVAVAGLDRTITWRVRPA
jgi:hypothetical protein